MTVRDLGQCPRENEKPWRRQACFKLPGAPRTVSLANSLPPRPTLDLQPSPCVRHIAQPMSPGRPNAHPRPPSPTPDPFSSPYPEKSVTLPRHPFSALPHPTPRTPHQSPRLRHFSPPIRPDPAISPPLLKHPHIRANLAHVRDRPRGPETLPPHEVRPQASLRKRQSKTLATERPLTSDAPPVLLCHAAPLLCPNNPAPALQNCAGPPTGLSYESHRMSQKRTEFAVPPSREQRCWGLQGNLKQARRRPAS